MAADCRTSWSAAGRSARSSTAERIADLDLLGPRHVQPRRALELHHPIGICNTAYSTLSRGQIKDLIGIYKQPDGRIYWIDPKVIDPATGRAVGADNLGNTAGFAGQVFFNPGAGEVGNLPVDGVRRSGAVFRIDLALSKRTRIGGRYKLEIKAEAFNLTNSVELLHRRHEHQQHDVRPADARSPSGRA